MADQGGRDRIIGIIRSLQETAKGKTSESATQAQREATEREAAAAADKIQQLLTAYKLEVADIPDVPQDDYTQTQFPFNEVAGRRDWRGQLLDALAKYNYCQVLLYNKTSRQADTAILIGKPMDIEVTRSLYDYLKDVITRVGVSARKEYTAAGNKCDWYKWERAYCMGVIAAIRATLQARRKTDMENASTSALVISSNAALAEATKRLYPESGQRRARGWSLDSSAWAQGYAKGKTISVDNAVGSGADSRPSKRALAG